jgi:hypothetical protein
MNSMNYTGNFSPSSSPSSQAQNEGAGTIAMATTASKFAKLQMGVLSNYIYTDAIGSASAASVVLSAGGAGLAFEGLAVPSFAVSLASTGTSAMSDLLSTSQVSTLTKINAGLGGASFLFESTRISGSLGLVSTGISVYQLFNLPSENGN